MRVSMAVPKAVGYMLILLATYYSLGNQGYKQSLNVFFQEVMGTKASHIHARVKREVTTPPPSSPIPPADPVDIDLVLDLRLPLSSVPSNIVQLFRNTLRNVTFPFHITQSVNITGINFTTACYPNMTGVLQCHCEEQFAWSCDKCNIYGMCSNATTDTCGCINGLPSQNEFCEPITSVALCPTPSPVITTPTITTTPMITTTTPMIMTTTTAPVTTTPMTTMTSMTTTTTTDPVDIDLVLDLRLPPNTFQLFRNTLRNVTFPVPITQSVNITGINFTTACYPNMTGVLQCQCEEQFAWSCDKCNIYGMCSNATTDTCRCINGLPSQNEFCEPITSVAPCPTPTPVNTTAPPVNTTTPPMSTTTLMNTTTPPMNTTTPPMTTTTTLMNMTTTPMTTTTTLMNTTTTPMTTTTTLMNTTTTPAIKTTPPMTTTTTLMNTTTTPAIKTTPPMTTTTTAMTTTTTPMITPLTTTPPPAVAIPTTGRNLTFVLDLEYKDEYNNPSHKVYQDAKSSIQKQCEEFISTLKSTDLIGFTSGSTVAKYTIVATDFKDSEIEEVKTGIFTQMGEIYPMIFDSGSSLQFEQPFFGKSATVTCGPPPDNLNFADSLTAEWRRDDKLILADSGHTLSIDNKKATLTVSRFFSTDQGRYECKLKGKNTFRQRSSGVLSFKETPLIQVTPLTKRVVCVPGEKETLTCSVNSPYTVQFQNDLSIEAGREIKYVFEMKEDCTEEKNLYTCQVVGFPEVKATITLETLDPSGKELVCKNKTIYGVGRTGDTAEAPCKPNEDGSRIAVCISDGQWKEINNTCILRPIKDLLDQSQFLNNNSLPEFLDQLSQVTLNFSGEVVESPGNINAIINILNNVAETVSKSHIPITQILMEDVLITAGILTTDGAQNTWSTLNSNNSVTRSNISKAESPSSSFLQSIETITTNLDNRSFDIATDYIFLNKTTFSDTFNADFNSTVEIDIPTSDGGNKSLTVITFSSMDNVLPPRDEVNSSSNVINGRVVLVQSSGTINNISFTFDIINDTLGNPQCVFWNFSLFNGLGGWDGKGCELIVSENETVTCNCNHLTSFSILMSPYSLKIPGLDIITYIGVGISMASLVICLIIEAVIWRKIRKNNTSYLRHVSIVNIAVSLLIANIWFIIGAAISEANVKNPPACTAATFFIHFFYLALFFWMLASALLLLYRTVSVFDGGLSKKSMLAVGFSLGYGAPLIIVIITIAVTAPADEYIRRSGVCWLNWDESRALLAFVIPALFIVLINLCILLVVIYKMLRKRAVRNAAQAAEKHVLLVIARSLAVLTPFFGLTWSLGVGTMTDPTNKGIHISFAFFNSLQGFFILVFGTLLDRQVRSEIAIKSQTSSGTSGTRSTSAGTSSSSGLGFLRNWRRGRDGYNVSSSNESGASNSFANT